MSNISIKAKVTAIFIACLSFLACYAPIQDKQDDLAPVITLAWPWDYDHIYAKGDRATMPEFSPGGPVYESIVNGNKGIQPPSKIVSDTGMFGEPGEEFSYMPADPNWRKFWKYYGEQ